MNSYYKKGPVPALLRVYNNTINEFISFLLGDKYNFEWNTYDSLWNNMYDLLKKYKTEMGNCSIQKRFIYEGDNLGEWVITQRINLKNGKLTKDKIEKLDDISFIWNPNEIYNNDLSLYHIQNLLIHNKTTSKDLAKILNLSHSAINSWIYNQENIPKRRIIKIAEILNTEPHLLQPQKGDGCVK